jgi:hypothetical protein
MPYSHDPIAFTHLQMSISLRRWELLRTQKVHSVSYMASKNIGENSESRVQGQLKRSGEIAKEWIPAPPLPLRGGYSQSAHLFCSLKVLPVFSSLSHPVECTIQQCPMWWGRKKNDDGLSHIMDDIASMQAHNMNFSKKIQNKCNIIPQDKNLTSLLNSILCSNLVSIQQPTLNFFSVFRSC